MAGETVNTDQYSLPEPSLFQIIVGSVVSPSRIASSINNLEIATKRAWQLIWLAVAVQILMLIGVEALRDWGVLPPISTITNGSKLFLDTPAKRIIVGTGQMVLMTATFPISRAIWLFFLKDNSTRLGITVGLALGYALVWMWAVPNQAILALSEGGFKSFRLLHGGLYLGGFFLATTYYMTLRTGLSYRRALFLNLLNTLVCLAAVLVMAAIFVIAFSVVIAEIERA